MGHGSCNSTYTPWVMDRATVHIPHGSLIMQQYIYPMGHCHRTLFLLQFSSIFNPTSHHIPYPTFPLHVTFAMFLSLCLSHSRTDNKNTIQLVQLVTEQLVYWVTDIPKQSCCGSSSTRSCTGTSSAATKHSHHSKFWTSQTRSMSRSASTA